MVENTLMSPIDREFAARLGQDTLGILRAGGYTAPSGRHVDLRDAIAHAVGGTVEHPPDDPLPPVTPRHADTRITVENRSVLEVGRRMAADGPVAALNFASPTYPGGGFLLGAVAQEEAIARSSALFAAIDGRRMYDHHRDLDDAMSSDWAIYSPDVPVFRTDEGELLEEPRMVSIVTCAAVNKRAFAHGVPERLPDIPAVMTRRTARMLSVAAHHGVRRFILGAWGCGAFGLDTPMMVGIFRDALAGPYRGVFAEIVFAITDWSPDQRTIGPFQRAFEGW
jgi:uncharacterized protein (TIGR02452 family)